MTSGAPRTRLLLAVAVVSGGLAGLAAPSAARVSARVFYLDAKPGQCLQGPVAKTLLVVPCSNPRHNLEVFAVVHGGWAGAQVPPHDTAFGIARRVCNLGFAQRFHHYIGRGYGWEAFWPDRGKEAAKYHDRIVCSLVRYPGLPPMGPGTHFRQAAAP